MCYYHALLQGLQVAPLALLTSQTDVAAGFEGFGWICTCTTSIDMRKPATLAGWCWTALDTADTNLDPPQVFTTMRCGAALQLTCSANMCPCVCGVVSLTGLYVCCDGCGRTRQALCLSTSSYSHSATVCGRLMRLYYNHRCTTCLR